MEELFLPAIQRAWGYLDVRQAEIHTAEPLVPEPSAAEVELAIDKLKSQKSPGNDQIPAELIKAGSRTICLEIHKLITSVWKNEKLPEEWKESIIVPVHKKGDKTDCSNYRGISLLPTSYKILSNILHPVTAYLYKTFFILCIGFISIIRCPVNSRSVQSVFHVLLLRDEHFVFGPKHSTAIRLDCLHERESRNNSDKKPTVAVFLNVTTD